MAAASLIKSIKYSISSIKLWIQKNPQEAGILAIILLVGAYLRLYRIDEYMTFLGDEGRDVIVVRRLLVNFDPILVGPGTSIGMMYLGPLYYYMMAPALFLAGFSPVGPSVQIALLGVATIFFIWYIAGNMFPQDFSFLGDVWSALPFKSINFPALIVAALYAVSPTGIVFSRSSWNPNIMPFFALLTVWSIWKVYKEHKFKWLIVLGISFAFVLNSHYLGILLAPFILVYWIVSYKYAKRNKHTRLLLLNTLYGIAVFAILMSPLLIFDTRHNFQNFKAMQEFVTHRDSSFKGLGGALENVWPVITNMFTRLVAGRDKEIGVTVAGVVIVSLVLYSFKKKFKDYSFQPLSFIALWVLIGVFGLAYLEREVYDHYMGFLFVAPYLLLAGFIDTMYSYTRKSRVILIVIIIFLFIANINNSPLKDNPSRQLQRSQLVSEKILDEAKSKKFNLAVLAERNYEDGYRYFLEVAGADVLHADRWDQSTIGDELFVVCEKPKDECKPTTDPKAEIVNFGWTKVENEWDVGGVILYRLSHQKI